MRATDPMDELTGGESREQGHQPTSASSPSPAAELAIQYAIAKAFAEADQLDEIAGMVLQTLADSFGWLASGLWVLDADQQHIRCAAAYPMNGPLASWTAATAAMRMPIGIGLPGRVWASEMPSWIRDIDTDDNFPRREMARASNIRHGFAFPIRVNGSVGAVIELFAEDVRDVDARQTEFFDAVGHQLGSFIERVDTRRKVMVSEARKTGVLNAAVDAIVSADRSGRILEFNPAAEALFGRSRSEVLGQTIAEMLVPPDLRDAHATGLRNYLATGEERIMGSRIRSWAMRADGSRLPIELTVTEISVDGEPMFTAFIRDVTVERQAEIARERFLEILSHELRTPVTTIYGGAMVLARSSLDPTMRMELISDIGSEADRLHRLIEDLIVLARAERGALAPSADPVRLDQVVDRVVASIRGQFPGVEMRISESGRRAAVRGDETYVEQLLRNLLSNAVKYGDSAAGIDIEIEHRTDDTAVRVLDRGPGIDPQEAGRLFEIDYRAAMTEGLAKGSGIGLFVARWLAEGMGGQVWAKPRADGGSEFGFALPTMEADEQDEQDGALILGGEAAARAG